MILITYANNETLEFSTVSTAEMCTLSLLLSGIEALGIRCNDASDLNRLQDYIAGIQQSINLRR
jgi:hypothetical protein